jgi:ribosomal protein S18 acetylase RimI-like enzyme
MKIRRSEISDFGEIFRVLNRAPELRHVQGGSNYNIEWVRNMIKNKKRYVSLVAESNGKIVGFLITEFWKDEKYSFVLDLYVDPKHRRNGVATRLYKEFESMCRKAKMKTVITSVLVKNKKMQNFMKKLRYTRGTEVFYYKKDLR